MTEAPKRFEESPWEEKPRREPGPKAAYDWRWRLFSTPSKHLKDMMIEKPLPVLKMWVFDGRNKPAPPPPTPAEVLSAALKQHIDRVEDALLDGPPLDGFAKSCDREQLRAEREKLLAAHAVSFSRSDVLLPSPMTLFGVSVLHWESAVKESAGKVRIFVPPEEARSLELLRMHFFAHKGTEVIKWVGFRPAKLVKRDTLSRVVESPRATSPRNRLQHMASRDHLGLVTLEPTKHERQSANDRLCERVRKDIVIGLLGIGNGTPGRAAAVVGLWRKLDELTYGLHFAILESVPPPATENEDEETLIRRYLQNVATRQDYREADTMTDVISLPVELEGVLREEEALVCTFTVKPHLQPKGRV